MLALLCAVAASGAGAYEADVHYGLTRWLAVKAGYLDAQADAIALANQRVDGGLMDTLDLALETGCVGRDVDAAARMQARHAPADVAVPAPPEARAVEPGGRAATSPLNRLAARSRGKEALLLGQFGEALHTLQDSWARQGIPAAPSPGAGIACDAALAIGTAAARGGPDSHRGSHTHRAPQDVTAMALATYRALQDYPPIEGRQRTPADPATLIEPLARFSKAATKTQKRRWFVSEGMADTSFLDGVTLPDGPSAGDLAWNGRQLPTLGTALAAQHDVAPDLHAFFDRVLAAWLDDASMQGLVARLADTRSPEAGRQLAARLALYRLRDHGAVADLAHAGRPFTAAQLARIARLVKPPGASVRTSSWTQAFYPLQARGPQASPLLPYVVRALPSRDEATPRVIAIGRPRHLPYDSLGWVAERRAGRWVLVDFVAAVDP